MNIDTSKSYATEANLIKALTEAKLIDCRPLIVRNREGRWTAVFSSANLSHVGYSIAYAAHKGFMTL